MALATLTIDINAKLANVERDLGKVSHLAEQSAQRMEASFAAAKTAFASMAAAFSIGAVVANIKSIIDLGDEINDLSQKVGISIQDLATWKLAAEQSGTSLESVAKGVKGLSTYMLENGKALRDAGINAKDANGALIQLADLFSAMPDGLEKTALAVKLFGKAGMDMIPMLNQGSAGLQEAADKSAEYGRRMVLMAPLADKFNDQMAELALQSKETGMSITTWLLPGLIGMATWLNDLKAGGERAETALEFLGEKSPLARGLIKWNKFINSGEARSQGFTGAKNALGLPISDLERQAADLAAFDAATDDYMKKREAQQRARGLLGKSSPESGAKKGGRPFDPFGDFEFKFAEMNEKMKRAGFDEADKALQRETEALQKHAEKIKDTVEPLRVLRREIDEVNKARAAGLLTAEQASLAEDDLAAKFAKQHESMLALKKAGEDSFGGIKDAIDSMGNRAADTFAELVVTGKASFSDLINSMLKDIARLQAKKMLDPITQGATDWLGNLFRGGGGQGSVQGNADYIWDLHSGGIAGAGEGSGQHLRSLAMFSGAPKYHGGGLAGDEMPAVLKRGEGVFTPGQMRALGAGRGGVQIVVNDQRTAPSSSPVSIEQGGGGDGMQQIRILIRDEVRGQIGSGQLDASMRASYGVARTLTKRG